MSVLWYGLGCSGERVVVSVVARGGREAARLTVTRDDREDPVGFADRAAVEVVRFVVNRSGDLGGLVVCEPPPVVASLGTRSRAEQAAAVLASARVGRALDAARIPFRLVPWIDQRPGSAGAANRAAWAAGVARREVLAGG